MTMDPRLAALDHYADRVFDLLVTLDDPIVTLADGFVWDARELGLLVDRAASAEEFDPIPEGLETPA